jgi:hypothetical protein
MYVIERRHRRSAGFSGEGERGEVSEGQDNDRCKSVSATSKGRGIKKKGRVG